MTSLTFFLLLVLSSEGLEHDFLNDHYYREEDFDYLEDGLGPPLTIVSETPGNPEHHSRVNFTHEECQHGRYRGYSLDNEYTPIINRRQGRIRFVVRFRGESDAHVIMSAEGSHVRDGSFYSVIIGAAYNRRTYFRRHQNEDPKEVAAISTPNILTPEHYRGFVIEYNTLTGDLALYPERSPFPILRWRDPEPIDVHFLSFCSFFNYMINVAYNCNGTDATSLISLEEAITVVNAIRDAVSLPDSTSPRLPEKYDPKSPPPPSLTGDPLKVTVGFVMNYFTLDMDEQVFIVNAWMRLNWHDSRLVFNSTSITDSVMRCSPDEIWKPDLTLYNNAYPTEGGHYADTHLLVSANGSVLWVPPARLAVHCNLNMIMWPRDTHTCELKFGSWTHHGKEIDLEYYRYSKNASDPMTMDLSSYIINSEWIIVHTEAFRNAKFYPCCPEPYIDLTFSVTIRRNSPSYTAIFVVPIVLIAIVNMLTMMLPPMAGEKLLISGLVFVVICIFLLYFQAKVPPMGGHLPLMVVLYVSNLFLVTLSILIAVVVINVARTRKAYTPSRSYKVLCNPHFARILGLGHMLPFIPKSRGNNKLVDLKARDVPSTSSSRAPGRWEAELSGTSETTEVNDVENLVDIDLTPSTSTSTMPNAEWIFVATAMDRISFIVYIFTNVVLLLICLW